MSAVQGSLLKSKLTMQQEDETRTAVGDHDKEDGEKPEARSITNFIGDVLMHTYYVVGAHLEKVDVDGEMATFDDAIEKTWSIFS